MPTYIVEGLDIPFLIFHQNEVEVGEFETEVAPDI